MDIETGEDKQAGDNKSGIEELLRASNMAVPGALDELEYVSFFIIFVKRTA